MGFRGTSKVNKSASSLSSSAGASSLSNLAGASSSSGSSSLILLVFLNRK